MKLPPNVKASRDRYVAKFPVPQGIPSDAFEEQARQWSIKLSQQVHFDTSDARWGMKKADPGRPISKDTITQQGSPLLCWDLLNGTGTGSPTLVQDPDSLDITGQVFVPEPAVDHVGGIAPIPPQPIPPSPGYQSLDKWLAMAVEINKIYVEELFRSVNANDVEGEANWLFHWREEGHDAAWIRAEIRKSPEWAAKHP